jgi:hypothetical protein
MDDKKAKGHICKGAKHGRSKLTEKEAAEIRAFRGEISARVLAEKYGIHQSQVSKIQTGKYWGSVTASEV